MSSVTNASLKDREHENWTRVIPGWQQWDAMLRSCHRVVTERMLSAAIVGAGHRVLDIASGTGEPAIPAAEQVGASGYVLGTDFVEDMLGIARRKADRAGLRNVEFRRVDGEELDVPAGSFDTVLCRWGIQFMPDAGACLVRAHRALRNGGRIAVACWAQPERNPWAAIPLSVIKRLVEFPPPPPGTPGVFSYADPAKLRAALEGAGFVDVRVDEVPVVFGPFDHPGEYFKMVRELAGQIAHLFAGHSSELQEKVVHEVCAAAETHRTAGVIQVPGVTWIASGRR
jgi:ubiquinone/menaquinone biosynthesis C-methylase UbiE